MNLSIFKPVTNLKRCVPFQEYMRDLMIEATRISEISPGVQRYSSAQFEIALLSFCDLKALKKEMDPDIEVDFPRLTLDWMTGFDWLDLSVSHHDQDAISYFQEKLNNNSLFQKAYELYKKNHRPDCALQNFEEIAGAPSLK